MVAIKQNPADSIKSTWRQSDRSQWGFWHWSYEVLGVHPVDLNRPVPIHAKTDKVPLLPSWALHRWILFYACIPLLVHHAYVSYTGRNFGPVTAFFFYAVSLKLTAIHQIQTLRRLGHIYGYFDGDKHERDGVPDVGVKKVFISLLTTSTLRPMMAVILSYRTSQVPSSINWLWLVVEIGLYAVMIDFWFYIYHRLMHDVPFLWQFHRTHHLTKHPNPLLSLYADGWQEAFDIVGIPLLAFFSMKFIGLPMGFYETWICYEYIIFTELMGHSGLRITGCPPSPFSPLLKYLNMELVVEDHDLHHRKGWKKSYNYGKQTRVMDALFGTSLDRIESHKDNIDYVNTAKFPLF